MKKSAYFLLFTIIILLFGLIGLTFIPIGLNWLSQIGIVAQIVYTFVTSIMVFLTYLVLKETKTQKNLRVRPYVVADRFNLNPLYDDEPNTLNFKIRNEGVGLALNLSITIKNFSNNENFFVKKLARLSPVVNENYDALLQISNQISELKKNGSNITMGYRDYERIEAPLNGDKDDYLNIEATILYEDIYKKRFKNVFKINFKKDEDDQYKYDFKEHFEEL